MERPVLSTTQRDLRQHVAADVLFRLDIGKLRPKRGYYLRTMLEPEVMATFLPLVKPNKPFRPVCHTKNANFIDTAQEAQSYVNTLEEHCMVCALGAAALSLVRLKDEASLARLGVSPSGLVSADALQMRALLDTAYDPYTIAAIECAFERDMEPPAGYPDCAFGPNGNLKQGFRDYMKAAFKFGTHPACYEDDVVRMRAIYQDIFNNHGIFLPEDFDAAF